MIRNHQVDRVGLKNLECLRGICGGKNFVSSLFQESLADGQSPRLVVNAEDGSRSKRRGTRRLVHYCFLLTQPVYPLASGSRHNDFRKKILRSTLADPG